MEKKLTERTGTHYRCKICDCRFGTVIDLGYHMKAHKTGGCDLPSMRNRNRNPISSVCDEYKKYIEIHGRQVEKDMFSFIKGHPKSGGFNYNSEEYVLIREQKIMTAGDRCEICGAKKIVECHHIIPTVTSPELGLVSTNLIVVCKPCHGEIHHRYNELRSEYDVSEWVDFESEEMHDCIQCGSAFYGPLYRKFCTTCYQHNKVDYY